MKSCRMSVVSLTGLEYVLLPSERFLLPFYTFSSSVSMCFSYYQDIRMTFTEAGMFETGCVGRQEKLQPGGRLRPRPVTSHQPTHVM